MSRTWRIEKPLGSLLDGVLFVQLALPDLAPCQQGPRANAVEVQGCSMQVDHPDATCAQLTRSCEHGYCRIPFNQVCRVAGRLLCLLLEFNMPSSWLSCTPPSRPARAAGNRSGQ